MAQVNTEMNISPSTTAVSLNAAQTRNLAVASSGAITLNDLHSKYQNNYTIINKPADYIYGDAYTSDSSGNIYCALEDGSGNASIFKFDQFYNLTWKKGITRATPYGATRQIAVDSSGNIFLIGLHYSANGVQVIKLDSSGTSVWSKTFQITSYLTSYDVVILSGGAKPYIDGSGNLCIPFSQDTGSTSYTKNAGFIKIDTNGNYITNYGASLGTATNIHLYYYDMAPDSTGSNLIFGGVWWPTSTTQGAIWKLSSSGTIVWQKAISDPNSYIYSVAVDSSGNVYAAGIGFNGSSYYGIVLKLDSSGNIQWSRNLSAYNIRITGIKILPSGNICATGWYDTGSTKYGAYFVYNTSGALQFSRVFSAPSNGVAQGPFQAQAGLGFVSDSYNNLSLMLQSYNADSTYAILLTKAPMVNNSNKLNATTITTGIGSSTFTLSSTATGVTESSASTTVSNTSFTAYTTPTQNTLTHAIATTTSSLFVTTAGMT